MSESRDAELRGNIPKSLMARMDALSQARGFPSRFDWLIPIIERECAKEEHAATVLLRILRINPLASSADGKDSE